MAGGRPKKSTVEDYNMPENWKDIIFELSSDGHSDVEIQSHFLKLNGLTAGSVQWMWRHLREINEEFSLTIQISRILCQAWWEKAGREGLHKEIFNTGCWYANMKNRFSWSDKKEIQHSGEIAFTLANKLDEARKRRIDGDAKRKQIISIEKNG